MIFPAYYPQNCPPFASEPANGEVFRLVRNSPPEREDFQTHFETGKLPFAEPCLRCGLSVFTNLSDVIHQRTIYPMLGTFVAKGQLTTTDGVTMLTKGRFPSHTTWWPFERIDRARSFRVVEES